MLEHRTISLAEQVFDRLETDILSHPRYNGNVLYGLSCRTVKCLLFGNHSFVFSYFHMEIVKSIAHNCTTFKDCSLVHGSFKLLYITASFRQDRCACCVSLRKISLCHGSLPPPVFLFHFPTFYLFGRNFMPYFLP
jgi:hypothetical protein